jgi:hypothetical protein
MPANEGTSWLGGSAQITPKTIKKRPPRSSWTAVLRLGGVDYSRGSSPGVTSMTSSGNPSSRISRRMSTMACRWVSVSSSP